MPRHRPRRAASTYRQPLSDLISRCLAKKMEDRFATVVDLVSALAPFGSGPAAAVEKRVRAIAMGSSPSFPDAVSSGPNVTEVLPRAAELEEAPARSVVFGSTADELAPTLRQAMPRKGRAVAKVAVALAVAGSGLAALLYASSSSWRSPPRPVGVVASGAASETQPATSVTLPTAPRKPTEVPTTPSAAHSASDHVAPPEPSPARSVAQPVTASPRSGAPARQPASAASNLYGRE